MSYSAPTKLHTSKLLLDILQQHQEEKIALKDILQGMGDRAFGPALLICAIPEALPIPIVGVSAIIGIPLMLVSGQLFLGFKKVWLPKRIGNFSFERKFLEKAILTMLRYLKKIERVIKPRWQFMSSPIANRLLGLLLLVLGVVIALPIPFGNFLPAIAIVIISLGTIEKDGLVIAIGILAAIVILTIMASAIAALFYVVFPVLLPR
ncbi:MAG: exopolysaccharide biosynthesis protein [Hydrococcus sp. Prado102]|jgi:hypothetical protein|nr:exopolysaccharide biosynthesis protein [Hydrococcus sp. Prado102]